MRKILNSEKKETKLAKQSPNLTHHQEQQNTIQLMNIFLKAEGSVALTTLISEWVHSADQIASNLWLITGMAIAYSF